MGTTNISSNGLKITISAVPLLPVPLEIKNLSANADVWSVNEISTADAEVGADGEIATWGINALIEATLTLSGASKEAKRLSALLKSQRKYGNIPPVVSNVSVTVYNEITGEKDIYTDGIMTGGSPSQSYGNQKKNDRVYNFKFGGSN